MWLNGINWRIFKYWRFGKGSSLSVVLCWVKFSVLSQMFCVESDVLCWVRCSVLSLMFCGESNVLCRVRCSVLSQMFCAESDVLWRVKCSAPNPMFCAEWNVLGRVRSSGKNNVQLTIFTICSCKQWCAKISFCLGSKPWFWCIPGTNSFIFISLLWYGYLVDARGRRPAPFPPLTCARQCLQAYPNNRGFAYLCCFTTCALYIINYVVDD